MARWSDGLAASCLHPTAASRYRPAAAWVLRAADDARVRDAANDGLFATDERTTDHGKCNNLGEGLATVLSVKRFPPSLVVKLSHVGCRCLGVEGTTNLCSSSQPYLTNPTRWWFNRRESTRKRQAYHSTSLPSQRTVSRPQSRSQLARTWLSRFPLFQA